MKIIFLDFDGVLVNFENDADPHCVEALNYIIERTKAKLVISSAWRLLYTMNELVHFLKFWGVKGEVIGKTISLDGIRLSQVRPNEIEAWLKNAPRVDSYVILDDFNMRHLSDRHVRTQVGWGLGMNHAKEAVKILEKKGGSRAKQ